MDRRRVPDRAGVPSIAAGLALLVVAGVWAVAVGADEPGPPTVLRAGCPAVLPGTSDALDDYADLVVWQGGPTCRRVSFPRSRRRTHPCPRGSVSVPP